MLPFEPCRVTSGYKTLLRPLHKGIDMVGKLTAATAADRIAVKAVSSGVVGVSTIITNKADKTWEWGNYVRIDLPSGEKHYYCHLASRAVKVGQRVKAGDVLGIMGNTGKSNGAHLHFEVRNKAGVSINPCPVLGIPNKVGIYYNEPQTTEGEDNMYRLYQVATANLSFEQAHKEMQDIAKAGGRPGIDRASSDGKYRVGNSVFASQSLDAVLEEFKGTENTFVG